MYKHLQLHRLIKLTGWTFEQIDDQPAALLDWLLAVDYAIGNG